MVPRHESRQAVKNSEVVGALSAIMSRIAAMEAGSPNATPQPIVGPATVPGWAAAGVAVKPVVAAPAVKTPKPLQLEIVTRTFNPATARPGAQPYEPFKVLSVHNGANGKFRREVSLDSRYLTVIAAFLDSPQGQAFRKTGTL